MWRISWHHHYLFPLARGTSTFCLEKLVPQTVVYLLLSSRKITFSNLSIKNRGKTKLSSLALSRGCVRFSVAFLGNQGTPSWSLWLRTAPCSVWKLNFPAPCHNHGYSAEADQKQWAVNESETSGPPGEDAAERDSSSFTALTFHTPSSQASLKTLFFSNSSATHLSIFS